MKDAKVMNDVRAIQDILEEYLGNRKAAKVALEFSALMQGKTKHKYREEVFFIHKNEEGELVLTMESEVKEKIQTILKSYLEEDEVNECLKQLMLEISGIVSEFETIRIPGSNNSIYAELLKHKPVNELQKVFFGNLKTVISKSVKSFRVFVYDPSMDNGKLQFVPGFKPAVGYSFNDWEEIANKNGLHIGRTLEYILFTGWLIHSLINEGLSEADAWEVVCSNASKFGYCKTKEETKGKIQLTGSEKIAGKCDLINTHKILIGGETDKEKWWWAVCDCSIAFITCDNKPVDLSTPLKNGVGWFVC